MVPRYNGLVPRHFFKAKRAGTIMKGILNVYFCSRGWRVETVDMQSLFLVVKRSIRTRIKPVELGMEAHFIPYSLPCRPRRIPLPPG